VSLLLELTLRGSVAALMIFLLDRTLAGRISGPSRRLWWCFIPLAFLVPLRIPVFRVLGHLPPMTGSRNHASIEFPAGATAATKAGMEGVPLEMDIWLAGVFAYVAAVGIQTARASRLWSRKRLSTDHSLLELLEDCKAETGVTAPIGLVVSSSVPSPAILGWLRPRILLPESLVAAASTAELRPILLHELAHFRWYDVPFNWLLTLVRAVHWFNPLAHFSAISWTRFREEAADEAAVKWMRDDSAIAYGDALVRSLRQYSGASAPFGSLAIVESVHHLKRRICMINHYRDKSPRVLLTGIVSLLLAAVVFSISARAADSTSSGPKAAVVAISQTWLKEIDSGQYQQAYDYTGVWFHHLVAAEEWIPWMIRDSVNLGKCTQRQQVKEVVFKTDPKGPFEGEWAYVEFESSFGNKGNKTQLVVLKKEADGIWKVAGYSIGDRKPYFGA
jgi:beta-lactamase regulating signal transducer with metallopeptidase domain